MMDGWMDKLRGGESKRDGDDDINPTYCLVLERGLDGWNGI